MFVQNIYRKFLLYLHIYILLIIHFLRKITCSRSTIPVELFYLYDSFRASCRVTLTFLLVQVKQQ